MATHVKVAEELSPSSESDLDDAGPSDSDKEENGHADDATEVGKTGMADVMAKILGKQTPKNKGVILGKGKTDKERLEAKLKKELEEEKGQSKKQKRKAADDSSSDEDESSHKKRSARAELEKVCRVKPDPTKREHERKLQKIATKGVVQLFNAVKKQQKTLNQKLEATGDIEFKKDRVLKSVSKGDFLDMLKDTTVNTISNNPKTAKAAKKNVKSEETDDKEEPGWKILRDDFMMGGTMKDWDKDSDEGDDGDEADDEDIDYSSGSET